MYRIPIVTKNLAGEKVVHFPESNGFYKPKIAGVNILPGMLDLIVPFRYKGKELQILVADYKGNVIELDQHEISQGFTPLQQRKDIQTQIIDNCICAKSITFVYKVEGKEVEIETVPINYFNKEEE